MFLYLVDRELGEQGLGLLVRHGGVDNHVVTLLPVDRSRDAVLVSDLQSYWYIYVRSASLTCI